MVQKAAVVKTLRFDGRTAFAPLVYASMDVQEPFGWLRLETAVARVEHQPGLVEVRCLDISAVDEAGVLHVLTPEEEEEFKVRFIEAYKKRGLHAVLEGR